MPTAANLTSDSPLPVAVLGAGPIGLTAAVHLARRGLEPVVIERADQAGAHVREWGHVRMFSPWRSNIDTAAGRLLRETGWEAPDLEACPTGAELIERWIAPLAAAPRIAPRIAFGTEVRSVSRVGCDRLRTSGRAGSPFVVRLRTSNGERDLAARAVIDATGTWASPRPLGAHGLPALGERAARERIFYGLPDAMGRDRERYGGRRVAVVGGGDSAFNVLVDLAALAAREPGGEIVWIVRGREPTDRTGRAQQLPERAALATRAAQLVATQRVRLRRHFGIVGVELDGGLVCLRTDEGQIERVDEVICVTGFRPDLRLTRELRLDLDAATEAPAALGPLIDPGLHSCATVRSSGVEELRHPEPGFYTVGMKSYGRAPTFLLQTGYAQVRSVVAAIARASAPAPARSPALVAIWEPRG